MSMSYPRISSIEHTDQSLMIAIRILRTNPLKRTLPEIDLLFQCTQSISFFKELNETSTKAHRQCCRYLTYQYIPKGQLFIKQGTEGNDFWITLKGLVKVFRLRKHDEDWVEGYHLNDNLISPRQGYQEEVIRQLGDGSSFGEKALLNQKNQRTANIETITNSHFAILNRNAFVNILNEIKAHQRLIESQHFRDMNLMRGWNIEQVSELFDLTKEAEFSYNQEVYQENSKQSEYVYFIKEGDFKLKVATGSSLDFKTRDLLEKTKSMYNLKGQRASVQEVQEPQDEKQEVVLSRTSKLQRYQKSHLDLTLMGQGEIFGDEDILYYNNNESQRKRLFSVQCISPVGKVYVIDINDFLVFIIKRRPLYLQWERATRHKVQHFQALHASSKFQLNNNFDKMVRIVSNFDYGEEKPVLQKILQPSVRRFKPESEPGYINQIYVSQQFSKTKTHQMTTLSPLQENVQKNQSKYLKKKKNDIPSSSEFIHLTAAKYNLRYDPVKIQKTTFNNTLSILNNSEEKQFPKKFMTSFLKDQDNRDSSISKSSSTYNAFNFFSSQNKQLSFVDNIETKRLTLIQKLINNKKIRMIGRNIHHNQAHNRLSLPQANQINQNF